MDAIIDGTSNNTVVEYLNVYIIAAQLISVVQLFGLGHYAFRLVHRKLITSSPTASDCNWRSNSNES